MLKKSFKRKDYLKKKKKSVEQNLTIFLMAAFEWFAAVEISSSASVTNMNTHTNVSRLAGKKNPDFKRIKILFEVNRESNCS